MSWVLPLRPKLVSFLYKYKSECYNLHLFECFSSQRYGIPSGSIKSVSNVLNRNIDLSLFEQFPSEY
jgi:hypothetical protein